MLYEEEAERAGYVAGEVALRETLSLNIPKSILLSEDFSYLGTRAEKHAQEALSRLHDGEVDPYLLAGYAMRCFMYHAWDATIHISLLTEGIQFDEIKNVRPKFLVSTLVIFDFDYWENEGHRKTLIEDVYGFQEPPWSVHLAVALEAYFFDQAAIAKKGQRMDDCLEFLGIAYELHGAIETDGESGEVMAEAEDEIADVRREYKLSTHIIERNRNHNLQRTQQAVKTRNRWAAKATAMWKNSQHADKSALWVAKRIAANSGENPNTIRRAIGHLKPSH